MVLTNKKVAILGAGPVGLTMAKLLQQEGVEVTVYERDEDPQARIWGGTLDLHEESGQKAMKKAGLLDRYYVLATPMGRTITDEQGNVLFRRQPALDNPEINRNDLRKMLLDSLAANTVVWDRKCTGIDPHDGKWRLHFDHKMDATADFVIGANGGMSNVRNYVTDATVEDTGTFMIQGEVVEPEINCPDFYQLCDSNILMSSCQGNLLVANPHNNGVLTYNVIFATPKEWAQATGPDFHNTDSTRAFLFDRFAHWGAVYHQLFRATSSFWGLTTRKLPLDKPWKQDRPLPITLVGDAAHLMSPFAGQGVNTGLTDALVLSDCLINGNDETLQAAIDDYERKMVIYAAEAQRETGQNEQAMRQPDFSFHKLIH